MTADALKRLLDQRVQRDPSSVITQEVVAAWTAEFGAQWFVQEPVGWLGLAPTSGVAFVVR